MKVRLEGGPADGRVVDVTDGIRMVIVPGAPHEHPIIAYAYRRSDDGVYVYENPRGEPLQ